MRNSLRSLLVPLVLALVQAAPGVTRSSTQALYPRIESISATTIARAGRLRIFGASFGAIKADSQVLIDGVPAHISRWSDNLVVAYVPDVVRIATVPVQVVTSAGSSNKLLLDVKINVLSEVVTTEKGTINWQFEVDGDYMPFRPTVGPDGTIYFQDDNGHLYALRPDGSIKWIFSGGYPAGPVAVGADNTTYIASGNTIQSISPAGMPVWQFTDPNSQGVIGGPAVGPDGKIYAVMDLVGLGAIALSPADGHLVWSNPGNPRLAEYGQLGLELVFGPATPGAQPDQFYFTCDNVTTHVYGHLYAFSLNGDQRWATSLGGISKAPQVAVAPNGTVSLGVAAYNPSNGSVSWSAYSALGSGSDLPTDIGSDGTAYVVTQYQSALAALNGQNGVVLWRIPGVSFEQGPVVSPLNDVVVVGGRDNYGLPGYFKAFGTHGQFLWQLNLPGEPYPGMFEYPFERGRFSLDGTTVYLGTTISGEPSDNLHCYLYAVHTADLQACTYSLDLFSQNFAYTGGESSVNVTAPGGCDWTAASNDNWITIVSASSCSGNETVSYLVRENFGATPRTGSLTVAGLTFTITQSAATQACTFTISPASRTFPRNGGAASVSVIAETGCSWSASSNASWITITSAGNATGDGVLTYSVSVNKTGIARVGTMSIAGKTFTVKQKPR